MNPELKNLRAVLKKAKTYVDVFGRHEKLSKDALTKAVKVEWRRLAAVAHADKYSDAKDKELAQEVFVLLNSFWIKAEIALNASTYGDEVASIKTKKHLFEHVIAFAAGDLSDVYRAKLGAKDVIVKVLRDPKDVDLLRAEEAALKKIHGYKSDTRLKERLPQVLDSFGIGPRPGLALEYFHGPTLADVIEAYPKGIDPRDAVWMFKRILGILSFTHKAGVTHGAILPTHIVLDLEPHAAALIGWGYSVDHEKKLVAIAGKYRAYYPTEVFDKKPVGPETDLFMLGKTMTALMGGDVVSGELPERVPRPLRALLRSLTLKDRPLRPDDASIIHRTLDEGLEKMFGPRKYRKFEMPGAANKNT